MPSDSAKASLPPSFITEPLIYLVYVVGDQQCANGTSFQKQLKNWVLIFRTILVSLQHNKVNSDRKLLKVQNNTFQVRYDESPMLFAYEVSSGRGKELCI